MRFKSAPAVLICQENTRFSANDSTQSHRNAIWNLPISYRALQIK